MYGGGGISFNHLDLFPWHLLLENNYSKEENIFPMHTIGGGGGGVDLYFNFYCCSPIHTLVKFHIKEKRKISKYRDQNWFNNSKMFFYNLSLDIVIVKILPAIFRSLLSICRVASIIHEDFRPP